MVLTEDYKKEIAPYRLREQRNVLLSETDWWGASDREMTQEQKDYRQALRDLPSTANPSLDNNGSLINVTWPANPESKG